MDKDMAVTLHNNTADTLCDAGATALHNIDTTLRDVGATALHGAVTVTLYDCAVGMVLSDNMTPRPAGSPELKYNGINRWVVVKTERLIAQECCLCLVSNEPVSMCANCRDQKWYCNGCRREAECRHVQWLEPGDVRVFMHWVGGVHYHQNSISNPTSSNILDCQSVRVFHKYSAHKWHPARPNNRSIRLAAEAHEALWHRAVLDAALTTSLDCPIGGRPMLAAIYDRA